MTEAPATHPAQHLAEDLGFVTEEISDSLLEPQKLPATLLTETALVLTQCRNTLLPISQRLNDALASQMPDRPRPKRNSDGAGGVEDGR
jgi:hypothetical protein